MVGVSFRLCGLVEGKENLTKGVMSIEVLNERGPTWRWETNQLVRPGRVVEVLIMPLDVVHIVLCYIPLVRHIEIESRIISFYGLG